MLLDSTPGYVPLPGAQVYNEAAFRRFLAADRARAVRLRRCLFLVLVSIRRQPGRSVRLPTVTATAVFRGLGASVREVDFVGWFREERVAAALLVQGPYSSSSSTAARIVARVRPAIEGRLPASLVSGLRVRVVRLGSASRD